MIYIKDLIEKISTFKIMKMRNLISTLIIALGISGTVTLVVILLSPYGSGVTACILDLANSIPFLG